ncbi:unnamed protein product [marine sediment metagenome]|uniref:Uncharacterized protein n=1 Tax=marine sediment metagenome TaxID=412755 RepID=X1E1A0_9ZZZZ
MKKYFNLSRTLFEIYIIPIPSGPKSHLLAPDEKKSTLIVERSIFIAPSP